jgi:hypothetical protein
MMLDWTWQCDGCGKWIEPYESHDIDACYTEHGVTTIKHEPVNPLVALAVLSLVFGPLALLFWMLA